MWPHMLLIKYQQNTILKSQCHESVELSLIEGQDSTVAVTGSEKGDRDWQWERGQWLAVREGTVTSSERGDSD